MIQPHTNLSFEPSSLIDWAYFGSIFLSIITGHRLSTRWIMKQEILGPRRIGVMTVSTIGRLIFWDYFQHVEQHAELGYVSQ